MSELCVLGAGIVVAFGCLALASILIVSAISRLRPEAYQVTPTLLR